MLKDTKRRILQMLIAVVVAIAIILASMVLWKWTHAIQSDQDRKNLQKVLRTIVKDQGESALLSLSGIPVSDIFYGDEGLSLFEEGAQPWRYSASEMQNISVYDKVNRSVVHITTTMDVTVNSFMDVLPAQGTGSGIVLSLDGYILTNAHVVEKAKSLKVTLYNEQSYEAKLIGLDSEDDLAVIQITVDKDTTLYPIDLGTSDDLKIGQKVIAIGNPFGYDRTMTVGVVSGLNRPVRTSEGKIIMNAIQTDASINPGNSGGPLLNSQSEVIGINSSIYSTNGNSQGINFAIPIDTAIAIIPDLIKLGRVSRGWLDIATVQLTPQLVSYGKLSVDKGVLVSQVVTGGLSEKAGLKGGTQMVQYGSSVIYLGGDIITAIGTTAIKDLNDLYLALLHTRSGDKVKVTVNRKGETKTIDVQLIERTAQHVSALVR
ncbi:trypsin-like peptidase domain-containing protein [Sphaerochaeta sp. PS]|uniref:S1C family serine protease n=1 Tax=Sphaerochaeta sp. PS TaxID=3076336 RepID=UPI0028A4607A|nr:trypsin-like peptidase domain-containing protein [Sphaerochaeta sp. PS]MDT4763303.1 trypsin-like peptidase domain-containing protein [Sphaerochaeta sp. PS]